MKSCLAIILLALTSASGFSRSSKQQARRSEPPRGSIAGAVTIDGKAAKHITVVLLLDNHDLPIAARTTTDEAGHFKFANLPSGRYLVRVIAPTWASAVTTSPDSEGKPVSVKDGQELQGIDLSLVRGGVITGRVTDADGQPVTGEEITLCQIAGDGSKPPCFRNSRPEFGTDDRGIYRIYGLQPGRYTVSVGKDRAEMGGLDFRGNHSRRFYPGTSNEEEAVPVEVASRGEALNIDVALSKPVTTYRVAGRILNAETGQVYAPANPQPPPEVQVDEGTSFASSRFTRLWGMADDKGRFEIVGGLVPGKYAAAVRINDENAEAFGEPITFEVTDHDIIGLDLKVRRGSALIGSIVGDRQADQNLISQKPDGLRILAVPYADARPDWVNTHTSPDMRKCKVTPDGAFRIPGLRPGKVRLGLEGYGMEPVQIVRIEGTSAPFHEGDTSGSGGDGYPDEVEVPAGQNLSGLRVVITFGSAEIYGHIEVVGGRLPGGLSLVVIYRMAGSKPRSAYVDVNGRFRIAGLPAGTYVLEASVEPGGQSPGAVPQNISHSGTSVTVGDGEKSEVKLSIELTQTNKRPDR